MRPIRFEHIPELGLSLEHTFTAKALSELLSEPRELSYHAIAPAQVIFNLERKGKEVLVTGRGQFTLSHPCVRCLKDLEIKHELAFSIELEHPETIQLEELMREELFLELPPYPACETVCLE